MRDIHIKSSVIYVTEKNRIIARRFADVRLIVCSVFIIVLQLSGIIFFEISLTVSVDSFEILRPLEQFQFLYLTLALG